MVPHPRDRPTAVDLRLPEQAPDPKGALAAMVRSLDGTMNSSMTAFFSQWEQPTSIFEQNKSFVCTVKIRILKDGTISSADIVRGSGNPVMDSSVMEALKRVSRIDPLPGGLGTGDGYTVNINFELQ